MVSKLAAKALIDWVPVSLRIITARFNSKGRKVTLIICYAPTNNSTDEESSMPVSKVSWGP